MKYAKEVMQMAVAVFFIAAASILLQISWQVHRTPNLLLKVEACVDYVGRAAKNFDDATRVWKSASQTEADYLKNTLPQLTQQVQTSLANVNSLVGSLKNTSDTLSTNTTQLALNIQTTLGQANTLLASTTRATDAVPGVLNSATGVLNSGTKATLDFDALVQGPVVTQTLQHVADSTANLAEGTKQGAAILADGRKEMDKFVGPKPWYQKVFPYTSETMRIAMCLWAKVNCTV